MTRPADLPIRVRITAAFAGVMLLLLAAVSAIVSITMRSALLDEIDTGLRFRAATMLSAPQSAFTERRPPSLDVQQDESFDQLLSRDGTVVRGTPGLPPSPLLTVAELRSLHAPLLVQRRVAGVQDTARLLAVPVGPGDASQVLVVGATTSDRSDALRALALALAVGGGLSIAVASLAGWLVAGLGLRPVEAMRRQASVISASGTDRRLSVPRAKDELHRLAETLNDMLQRLEHALSGERRFLARASHELRTPLASLQAELELARSRPRSKAELVAALGSAAEETDHLVRLANDLLVLARADGDALPVRRQPTDLDQLVLRAVDAARPRAGARHITVEAAATTGEVLVDPLRTRQSLDNLLDNALRHTPSGGTVTVQARVVAGVPVIEVRDTGPGFDSVDDSAAGRLPGLGLRIVRGVAAGHGGSVTLSNPDGGGAVVVLRLAAASPAEPSL